MCTLKESNSKYKFKAKKSLGQNFIFDSNITEKIVRSAGDLRKYDVLEIGPGHGILTRSILESGARRVVVIEKDSRFLKVLEKLKGDYPERLFIINDDILSFEIAPFLRRPIKVISNLPYNIGTQILINFLNTKTWPPFWESLTLMFQNEVANRIVAQPRSKVYGRLSILSQLKSNTKIMFKVPATAFNPSPKVESAVVRFLALSEPKYKTNQRQLEALVKLAFNKRRKMLRHTLRNVDINIISTLEKIDIDPRSRPEELSLEKFCKLANILKL